MFCISQMTPYLYIGSDVLFSLGLYLSFVLSVPQAKSDGGGCDLGGSVLQACRAHTDSPWDTVQIWAVTASLLGLLPKPGAFPVIQPHRSPLTRGFENIASLPLFSRNLN